MDNKNRIMKAPDKIYLEMDKEIDKIHHLWGQLPVVHSGYEHIEYIRKDALLEWANNALSSRRNMGDDYFIPAIVVLNELIDKLDSM